MIFTIALRNLARHKVKTVLTATAITVSVAVYIFISSWLGGMAVESRRNIVNYDMSAAKLQTKLYFEMKDEKPSYESFTNWQQYRDALDKEGYNSTPRFVFSGMLFSNYGSAPMTFNAVDVDGERKVLHYVDYVEFGRYPQSGTFEIAVGMMAAEKLRVGIPTRPRRMELEEFIDHVAQNEDNRLFINSLYETAAAPTGFFTVTPKDTADGNERMILKRSASSAELNKLWDLLAATDRNNVRINAVIDVLDDGVVRHINQLVDAVVVGVINSPDPVPNGNTAYIPMDALQDDAGMRLEGAVTELLIRKQGVAYTDLPSADESAAAITAALKRAGTVPDSLGVFFWLDYMSDYLGYEAMQTGAPQVIAFLLLFLSFLGISNTVLLAILERTKEISMMRALGMTDRQLITAYMTEAGILGFVGSVFGMILGCAINYPMVKYGWDLSEMADSLGGGIGFRLTSVLRSAWNIPLVFGAGISATLVAAVMAYFPTKRAVKMPITDGLKFD